MTPEELRAHAALAGLGLLDGEERAAFERALRESPEARAEAEAFASIAGRLGLAVAPVAPAPRLRHRVLAATRPRSAANGWPLLTGLAAAAAVLFAIGFFVVRAERDEMLRAADVARAQTLRVRADLLAARESLARETALRALMSQPQARLVNLGPLPPAPRARGRVLFDPQSREAVLIASGLDPAPEGKGYEVWVIGKSTPVPAGVFQVDASGHAVHRLPRIAEVEWARTFAVTLEPAKGVAAPTGPMVLAGAIS